MQITDIERNYEEVCNNITEKKLSQALIGVKNLLTQCPNAEYNSIYQKQKQTYSYLLEYTFKGIKDPERPKIYRDIQISLIELAENIKHEILSKGSGSIIFYEKSVLELEVLRSNINISQLYKDLISEDSPETSKRKEMLNKLFFLIWFSDTLSDDDVNTLKKIALSKKGYMHEKSVIVSALTIGLLHRFDISKFNSLFEFYDANEQFVWNRALVGLIFAFSEYDKRLYLYPEIISRMILLYEDKSAKNHIENILLQLVRTKETKKISDKLRNEIIPEMAKYRPKFDDKLDLDKIISDSLIEDANPDWEEVFGEAPDLLGKMEEFSKLQLDGSDVFMSAFAMLKHFPFFKDTSNWFLPFYKENDEIIKSFDTEQEGFDATVFTEGLERSVYICNSDKYSFCLNIKMMPLVQKNMIIKLFKMEMDQMNEINKEDEILNKGIKDKHIFTRYIQDLYRFYKLHPWKKDIKDIFETTQDIHKAKFFKTVLKDDNLLMKIAELNFKKKYFEDAIEAYLQMGLKGKHAQRIFEKIGFAYQKMQDFEQALKYYTRAELYDEKSLWLTKKIAFCYRKNHEYEKAFEYYKKAEIEEPDNLHIQANIGHCLLYSEKYQDALKYYHKVEYYEPNNYKVMRPLAWCSLLTGKYDTAGKYYKKIVRHTPNAYDFINFGHVMLCKDNKEEAVKLYTKALKESDIKTIIESINDDRSILTNQGVDKIDLDLLIDYLAIIEM